MHHVIQIAHVLVVHALAGDDGDRLRGVALAHRQFGRCLHGTGGVGSGVLCGAAQCRSVDTGGAKLQRAGDLRHQQIGAIGLLHGGVTAARQNVCQPLGHAVLTLKALAGFACGQAGIGRQGNGGLAAKLAERLIQRAGID